MQFWHWSTLANCNPTGPDNVWRHMGRDRYFCATRRLGESIFRIHDGLKDSHNIRFRRIVKTAMDPTSSNTNAQLVIWPSQPKGGLHGPPWARDNSTAPHGLLCLAFFQERNRSPGLPIRLIGIGSEKRFSGYLAPMSRQVGVFTGSIGWWSITPSIHVR